MFLTIQEHKRPFSLCWDLHWSTQQGECTPEHREESRQHHPPLVAFNAFPKPCDFKQKAVLLKNTPHEVVILTSTLKSSLILLMTVFNSVWKKHLSNILRQDGGQEKPCVWRQLSYPPGKLHKATVAENYKGYHLQESPPSKAKWLCKPGTYQLFSPKWSYCITSDTR